jgi:hypothetical protein
MKTNESIRNEKSCFTAVQNFRGASGSGFGNSDPGRKGGFPVQILLAEHSVND